MLNFMWETEDSLEAGGQHYLNIQQNRGSLFTTQHKFLGF